MENSRAASIQNYITLISCRHTYEQINNVFCVLSMYMQIGQQKIVEGKHVVSSGYIGLLYINATDPL